MSVEKILERFDKVASNPKEQFDKYISEGKKVVLTAPVYTPEEIIHSMGMVPMGVWGADIVLEEAKEYFPTFICSIMQSVLELGIKGVYKGASAIVIPSLCDSLKCLGQNWKYAVKDIPFIPMTYPQNRDNQVGIDFTKAGYKRVIKDLTNATGIEFDDKKLIESEKIYNEHNKVMRELDEELANHSEISARQRCSVYKSAFFMLKEEHTELVKELIKALKETEKKDEKVKIMTTGILCDSPALLDIIDNCGFQIVADDVAAESRQYRTDTVISEDAIDALACKFAKMDNCSVLYDIGKKRPSYIVNQAKQRGAKAVVLVLTKFCDPEEFDAVPIKRECNKQGMHFVTIEVDRQMMEFGQIRTMMETLRDILD